MILNSWPTFLTKWQQVFMSSNRFSAVGLGVCYLKMCVTLILNSVPFQNGLTNQFLWTFTIDSHFSEACESWKWHFIFNSNCVFSSESNNRFEIKYNFNCSKRNVKSNQIKLQSHHLGLHALQFHSSSELIFQDKTAPPQSSNFHKVNCFFPLLLSKSQHKNQNLHMHWKSINYDTRFRLCWSIVIEPPKSEWNVITWGHWVAQKSIINCSAFLC